MERDITILKMCGHIQNIEVSDLLAKSSEHSSPMLHMIHSLMGFFLQRGMDAILMARIIH